MMGLLNARWPQRLADLPWGIVLLVLGIGLFGMLILYSAAGGDLQPWALNHGMRLGLFVLLMLAMSQLDLAHWARMAPPVYAIVLASLILVEVLGAVRGGAQRWLDLGFMRLQPSELMKLALVLMLARIYHFMPAGYAGRLAGMWLPLLLVLVPVGLVLLQPDLGTAVTLVAGGAIMMFLGGLPKRWLLVPGLLAAASLPFIYGMLHDYQQRRVMTFLDPSIDPLGAGYHITQSKIAIGSGGLSGKGFLQGSQAHLHYLPEQHTDFVFATMAEEWGFLGGAGLIIGFGILLAWAWRLAIICETSFARLICAGLASTIFFYVFINVAMVMGLAPVVGIPLPLVSYGGSAMLTVMMAIGILLSMHRQRHRTTLD
jgi:rod shape determining protein RodA